MRTVKTYLVRKPATLQEVEFYTNLHSGESEEKIVGETIELTPEEYADVCRHPLADRKWLDGKGELGVIELTCKGERPLYVNTGGYDYCRYMGLAKGE